MVFSQYSYQDVKKDEPRYFFGQIFAGFHYGLKNTIEPRAAFIFNQGILGYYHELSGKIMLDFTRTTHIYKITDTAGNALNVDYFEGSKYTAYLKMAEIKWKLNDHFDFRVGQLLNTQYLTFQDKFWGFRYIDVTPQEKYRLGMPADFGVQLDYNYKGKFLNQFSIVNGEGPFRFQDMNGKFLYSNNMQYNPIKNLTLKLYVDYSPDADTSNLQAAKSVISTFAGYKIEKFAIGGEFNYVFNYAYLDGYNVYNFSVYGNYAVSEKIVLVGRFDHLASGLLPALDYYIIGFQYAPVKGFTTSANFRYYSVDALPLIYANFGLKF